MLESYIRAKRETKDILLMTHIVIGYPSFEDSLALVESMVDAGVDLMELQIPFSEPVADGPVIARACQDSIASGSFHASIALFLFQGALRAGHSSERACIPLCQRRHGPPLVA